MKPELEKTRAARRAKEERAGAGAAEMGGMSYITGPDTAGAYGLSGDDSANFLPSFHGASFALLQHGPFVMHATAQDSLSQAPRQTLLRSYSDGIRVGCTFVSTEALETIYRLHRKYLDHTDYMQHQAGDGQ